jgi:hypothetical protein
MAIPRPAHADAFESLEDRTFMSVAVDSKGWTNVTPSADTRTIYVSSSEGSDSNNGLSANSPVKTINKGRGMLRSGSPDHLLLKRGDAWTEKFGLLNVSGRSEQEPILISAYGTGDRPLLNTRSDTAIVTNVTPVNHVAIVGIRFNSNTNDPGSPDYTGTAAGYGFYGVAPVNDLLIEDCYFEHYSTNLLFQNTQGPVSDISVRRNVVVDATGGRSQGSYVNGVNGVLFEENLFDHNGWSEEVTDEPSNIFNHNLYMSARNEDVVLRGNIFANASSHGVQARAGGVIENNLFLKNPIGLLVGNGSTYTPGGVYARVADNVFLDSRDINGSPRGYGMEFGNTRPGAGSVAENNIVAHDGQRNFAAIKLSMGNPPDNLSDAVGLNDLTIRGNTVYDWYQALSTDSGYVPGASGFKALNGLVIQGNDFQQTISTRLLQHGTPYDGEVELWDENHYWDDSPASGWFSVGGTTTSFDTWQVGLEPSANRTQRKYVDPNRTVGTYNRSLGGAGTSDAFLAQARAQSRQSWRPQFTADAVNDYVRDGFRVDSAVPTAGLEARDVNALGGSGHAFIVQYTDDNGIDPRSLDSSDVRVTGPNGYSRAATLVSVDRAGTTTRAAVYSIVAPDGVWREKDAGLYSVTVQSDQVADLRGNSLRGGVIGTFWVRNDAEAPAASARVDDVTVAGGKSHTITVTYTDNHAVDVTSLGTDLLITGPNGFEQFASLVGVDNASDGSPRVATYVFTAPDGAWDGADNGEYTVTLRPDEVRDISGNFNPGEALATFRVGVSAAPLVTARASTVNVTGGGAVTHGFSVRYEGPAAALGSAGTPDVQVAGPGGFVRTATVESVATSGGGTVRVVTYSIVAPDGVWDARDAGVYLIRPKPRTQSADSALGAGAGSSVLPQSGSFGSFHVDIAARDLAAPMIVSASFSATNADKMVLRFSENVKSSLSTDDFEIIHVGRGRVASSMLRLSYDTTSNKATLTFAGLPAGELGRGIYRLVLKSSGVKDGAGNKLEVDAARDRTVNGNYAMYWRKNTNG